MKKKKNPTKNKVTKRKRQKERKIMRHRKGKKTEKKKAGVCQKN